MFKRGGTTVDAAIAAAAVLAVVYPHHCSLGGDLFALIRRPDGTIRAINGSGAAGSRLKPSVMRGLADNMPIVGPYTITVPGVVRGWETLLSLAGRFDFQAVLGPAIDAAARGVPVSRSLAAALQEGSALLAKDSGAAELFLPKGRPLGEGEMIRQPALAQTLTVLAEEGSDSFYSGRIAHAFLRFLGTRDAPLTRADLEHHVTQIDTPISGSYRGWQVLTTPPNSQGFALLQILALIELLGVDPDPLGPAAATIAEVFSISGRDRDRWLADPLRNQVPLDMLLGQEHLSLLADVIRRRASRKLPGDVPVQDRRRSAGDTAAIVAVDSAGTAVSLVQSVFHAFGAGLVDPHTGILFHNRGASFSSGRPGRNRFEPQKRPPHTLMAVFVQAQSELRVAAGTMGGRGQAQIHAQLLLHLLDQGQSAERAVDMPRWVVGGLDLSKPTEPVFLEQRVPGRVLQSFRSRGMPSVLIEDWSEEVGQAVLITASPGGTLAAASDPRSDGSGVVTPL